MPTPPLTTGLFQRLALSASHWGKHLLNHQCQLCQQASKTLLCHWCTDQLRTIEVGCQVCANPLPNPAARICGDCLRHPKPFRQVFARYAYQSPLDRLVWRFKQGHPHPLGAWFSDRMLEDLVHKPRPDILVPVPSHWRKQFLRGYNPAQVLCEKLATAIERPSCCAVRRTGHHFDQKRLNRTSRLHNLKSVFQCEADLQGANIAVVDDVVTTAATAIAIASGLKAAGAGWVDIWCLARTP